MKNYFIEIFVSKHNEAEIDVDIFIEHVSALFDNVRYSDSLTLNGLIGSAMVDDYEAELKQLSIEFHNILIGARVITLNPDLDCDEEYIDYFWNGVSFPRTAAQQRLLESDTPYYGSSPCPFTACGIAG